MGCSKSIGSSNHQLFALEGRATHRITMTQYARRYAIRTGYMARQAAKLPVSQSRVSLHP